MPVSLSPYLTMPEEPCVRHLIDALNWDGERAERVREKAVVFIERIRAAKQKPGSIEGFFRSYSLSTQEGLSLMCLAEAVLRIPDSETVDALIADKISGTEWGKSDTASGKDWLMRLAETGLSMSRSTLDGPFAKIGAPVIRKAMAEGMKRLGGQFVLGETVPAALKNAATLNKDKNYLFSFDMLGEGARTAEDAERYFEAYAAAIESIGQKPQGATAPYGISVKLSALHPRYSFSQEDRCVPALVEKLVVLAHRAANHGLCLTVDAEESERLETAQKIIQAVIGDEALKGWDGFGLAVQAYEKRTFALIDNLAEAARRSGRKIQVRLVKGAYWDTEIKRAQMKGLDAYPVFTRKAHTDVSYIACSQKLLSLRDCVYPMFGTHNAHTVAAILDMAGGGGGFEFQKLYGMGDALYESLLHDLPVLVRIYAPVGKHRDLLPYLVRRLLENGANSSFVNRVLDPSVRIESLTSDPVETSLQKGCTGNSLIPLPSDLYLPRRNARGFDLDDASAMTTLMLDIEKEFERRELACTSIVGGRAERSGNFFEILNPANKQERIGTAYAATELLIDEAFKRAKAAQPSWNNSGGEARAVILERTADALESSMPLFSMLCQKEAGKTYADAIAEIREAIDFCRYYAAKGRDDFNQNGTNLQSYTGERNKILLQGRGVFVCISPWNFPLAIFTGQVAAALMAGNTVLAKPAEQTPFIAQAMVTLMHRCGVPKDVLHLIIGDGLTGQTLIQHENVGGVAFTGSTDVAKAINRTLAGKDGAIVPLIAETGGVNAIIADASAHTEQLVDDVIISAFGSAGQRCSACRVLFIQADIAERVIAMLQGAMAELKVGDPASLSSDIGPLIDEEALAALQKHKSMLDGIGKFIAQAPLDERLKRQGHYFSPVAYEIAGLPDLKKEVFGPALHVIRYKAEQLQEVIRSINDSGYGLTFGLHSRIDQRCRDIENAVQAGNIYINRSIIGAVVGVQPFGGNGLSGTGPKAGGPYYLHRFATEKTVSVNTTAAGGNTALAMLGE